MEEEPPEDPEVFEPEAPRQRIFVRPFLAPAGAPWDQGRAAGLEARLGAPLPLAEIVYQVQRLEPWRPGRPARFAAFYARARDVGEALEEVVEVDGQARAVRFVSARVQARKAQGAIALALLLGMLAASVGTAFAYALVARGADAERLESLTPAVAGKARLAKALDRQRRESRALENGGVRGLALSDYLSDLAWASAAKAPGARIDAVHWDHGLMAVEAHGDQPPFAAGDRQVTKVPKPIRPGLWLWGVEPAAHRSLGAGQP
ncbi:hypothetical protein [Caulobacter sp. KR2-114]|uniref:hypothetical protein n=1 Tax=Caulobacter sp. KR2-114 TaxID=3400912 RepID=UPI003C2C44C7